MIALTLSPTLSRFVLRVVDRRFVAQTTLAYSTRKLTRVPRSRLTSTRKTPTRCSAKLPTLSTTRKAPSPGAASPPLALTTRPPFQRMLFTAKNTTSLRSNCRRKPRKRSEVTENVTAYLQLLRPPRRCVFGSDNSRVVVSVSV